VIQVEDNRAPVSFWRVICTAVLINLLNPKLTIFFFAFLPQLVPACQPNGTQQMMGLSGVFMALVRRVRPLRRIRGDGAHPGNQPPQSHVVAAPHSCLHLYPACRSPGRR
jgi:hypothetical protein